MAVCVDTVVLHHMHSVLSGPSRLGLCSLCGCRSSMPVDASVRASCWVGVLLVPGPLRMPRTHIAAR